MFVDEPERLTALSGSPHPARSHRHRIVVGGHAVVLDASMLESLAEEHMQVHYLEIVTPDVDATCGTLAKLHGVTFSAPKVGLGNARTAQLGNGGLIGVRAPMHPTEEPVVRPYLLVQDVEAATAAAEAAGGEIAHPPMEIPGHGRFSIYIQGGVHHGLWQV